MVRRISIAEVARKINSNIADRSRRAIKQASQNSLTPLQRRIEDLFLTRSSEVASLKEGILRGEFGLENSRSKINKIIKAISQEVEITVQYDRQSTRLTISLLRPGSYSKLIQMPEAQQLATGARASAQGRFFVIPWLEWLLLAGNELVIPDSAVFDSSPYRGRSGLPYLMTSQSLTNSSGYRVNPLYQGTADNNFITRLYESSRGLLQGELRRIREAIIKEFSKTK